MVSYVVYFSMETRDLGESKPAERPLISCEEEKADGRRNGKEIHSMVQ